MVNQPDPNMNNPQEAPQQPAYQAPQQPEYQQAPQQPQYQQQAPQYQQAPAYQPPVPQVVMFEQEDVMLNKGLGMLAYLFPIYALVQNVKIKSEFVTYHLNNVIKMMIVELIVVAGTVVLGWIPIIGWIAAIAAFITMIVVWVMGILSAKNGIGKPLPIIGNIKTVFIR